MSAAPVFANCRGRPCAGPRAAARAAPTIVLGVAIAFALPALADEAVLQGLDKTTARISRFEAPLEQPVKFGTLTITVRACKKRPPEEPPESAA
jgi:hypothetical protein